MGAAAGLSHTNTADTATTLVAALTGERRYHNAYLAAKTQDAQFSLDGGTTWIPVMAGTYAILHDVTISGLVSEKNLGAGANAVTYAIVW